MVLVDVAILAVDCDDPARAPHLYDLADELTAAGERPVLLESGQPGRLHLLCRVRDGRFHERLAAKARQLGLDVRSKIRPPLSPHRLGLSPRLISPAEPLEALAALEPPFPPRRRNLSRRMRELLEEGDVSGLYRSRSEGVLALAVAAVNARWTFDEFRAAIERSPAGEKLRGRTDAETELRRCWGKAIRRVRVSPPITDRADAAEIIAGIRRVADSVPWKGRGGATDRAVLEVHLALAMRLGRVEYDYALRDAADDAGLGLRAAARSHTRLRNSGWLTRRGGGRRGISTRWRLSVPANVSPAPTHTPLMGGVREYVVNRDTPSPGGDVFRWRSLLSAGLGKSAWRVYAQLQAKSAARTQDVALTFKMGRSALHKQLRRLESVGLAVRVGHGLWRRGVADLEEIERRLGVAGIGASQRAAHEREREEYRERLRPRKLHFEPIDRAQAQTDSVPSTEPSSGPQPATRAPIEETASSRPVKRRLREDL